MQEKIKKKGKGEKMKIDNKKQVKNNKNIKGITLIALVVTIIVLLILARSINRSNIWR